MTIRLCSNNHHAVNLSSEENLTILKDKWKILIVDDDEDVHTVTKMVLKRIIFEGRGIEFISAYSAEQAKRLLLAHYDIAVILLDVVMEEENSGLDLVRFIRKEMGNLLVRIILRTGYPGQAPEERVTIEYDINDYREKTDLTTKRLITTTITALRSYRDLVIVDDNRKDMRQLLDGSLQIFRLQSIRRLATSVMEQLTSFNYIQPDKNSAVVSGFIAEKQHDKCYYIHAASGVYKILEGREIDRSVDDGLWQQLEQVCGSSTSVYKNGRIAFGCQGIFGCQLIVYLDGVKQLTEWEKDLFELYRLNILVALDNIDLNNEIEVAQRELFFTLGEVAESRSPETSRHVKRVAEITKLLALKYGIKESEAELMRLAASLHDIGKIAIADDILNKPGRLTSAEFELMKEHTVLGEQILKASKSPLFQMAAVIAREHHENYDGTGYPTGLRGEEIQLNSRIVALVDVFDALGNKRVYKEPWHREEILEYIHEQRGKKFDPVLVELFFANIEEIFAIRQKFPD